MYPKYKYKHLYSHYGTTSIDTWVQYGYPASCSMPGPKLAPSCRDSSTNYMYYMYIGIPVSTCISTCISQLISDHCSQSTKETATHPAHRLLRAGTACKACRHDPVS